MSYFKNADGIYEADIRVAHVGRWHGSLRTRKKAEAEPRYQAVRRLFREAKGANGAERRALIEDLRAGRIGVERIESMVANHEPLVTVAAVGQAPTWPTVDDAIAQYLDWVEGNQNRRKSTWNTARAQLRRFAKFEIDGLRVGSLPLDQVTSRMADAYQRALIAIGTPPNTVLGYVRRIGTLWAWIQRRENRAAIEQHRVALVVHSPLDPETTARETSRRDRYLTYDEAELLLAATPERLLAVVGCGLFAGLRIGEALTLRPSDIDLVLGTIAVTQKQIGVDGAGKPMIWKPKTKRAARVVPIAPPLAPIIAHHLEAYASADWLMPALEDPGRPFAYKSYRNRFAEIVAAAELVSGRKDPRGVVFHTLRHTFASWLVMRGVDLYTVAQLLGDTLQMVENTYAHLAPDFKKRAVAALEGAVKLPERREKTATESATTEGLLP